MFKYSNISLLLISFLVVISISNCTRDFGPSPVNEGYSILPPSKLPWPHQKPDLDINDYNVLIKDLWIINNFGQYQGGDTKESLYFHDGLDIVLDNGKYIADINFHGLPHIHLFSNRI